jgi:hypothetical protein
MVDQASQRSSIRVSYECASNGTRETTTASELSLGGVFIETTQKTPQVGAFVAIEIESGSTRVNLDGRVLSASPKGFSVSFIDLPNDAASALAFILATKMPRRGTTLGLGEAEEGVAKYISERNLPTAPKAPAPPRPAEAAPADEPSAPRHPTPRMMRAEPSRPPPPAPVVPPAPISSGAALAPVSVPPRPSAPPFASPSHPPAAAWQASRIPEAMPSKSNKALVLVAAGVVLLVLIVIVILALQS